MKYLWLLILFILIACKEEEKKHSRLENESIDFIINSQGKVFKDASKNIDEYSKIVKDSINYGRTISTAFLDLLLGESKVITERKINNHIINGKLKFVDVIPSHEKLNKNPKREKHLSYIMQVGDYDFVEGQNAYREFSLTPLEFYVMLEYDNKENLYRITLGTWTEQNEVTRFINIKTFPLITEWYKKKYIKEWYSGLYSIKGNADTTYTHYNIDGSRLISLSYSYEKIIIKYEDMRFAKAIIKKEEKTSESDI